MYQKSLMKYYFTYVFLLLFALVNAQDINQFDVNGERHGAWKKNFEGTDQVRYEGTFEHGKEVGLFKFYKLIKKKSLLTATKQFNIEDNTAYVQFLSSRGKVISEGKMKGKTYVGDWKYYHNNSSKIMTTETYTNQGKLTGKRLVYYNNGQLAEEANYEEGTLEGISKWYSLKGVVLKQFIYKQGELNGVSEIYNGKGELLAKGQYKAGKKVGVWKYYENGKLKEEKDFNKKPRKSPLKTN